MNLLEDFCKKQAENMAFLVYAYETVSKRKVHTQIRQQGSCDKGLRLTRFRVAVVFVHDNHMCKFPVINVFLIHFERKHSSGAIWFFLDFRALFKIQMSTSNIDVETIQFQPILFLPFFFDYLHHIRLFFLAINRCPSNKPKRYVRFSVSC